MKKKYTLKTPLLCLVMCLMSIGSWAQTTLIDPAAGGGFELGTTFTANGWTTVNATTNTWQLGTVPAWFSGSRGAYISNNTGTSWVYSTGTAQRSHFYRDIAFPAGETSINLSFLWRGNGNDGNWDNLQVYLVDVTATPTTASPTGTSTAPAWLGTGYFLTQISGTSVPTTSTSVSYTFTAAQATYAAGTTKRIVFTWKNDGGGGTNPPASVDNISLTSSCPGAAAAAATLVTNNSAQLNWTAFAGATGYNVEYRLVGAATWTALTGSPFAGTSAPLTGLLSNSNYEFRVAATGPVCNAFSIPVSFTTSCDPIITLPFTETFEPASTTEACWRVVNVNGDADSWTLNGTNVTAHGGAQQAQFYTDGNGGVNNDWLISPPITLTANQQLKYWYRSQSASEPNDYTIKISTTGSGTSDFTTTLLPLTSVSNTTYQENIISLAAYTGTVYIAFHVPAGGADGWYLYFDDVTIDAIPTCPVPTAMTVTPTAATTANVAWTCATCTGQFIVEYGPAGFTPGTAGTAGTGGTISSSSAVSPYSLTGLSSTAITDVYVRQFCGGTDFSPNTAVAKFIPGDVCANAIDLGALTSPVSGTTTGAANNYTNACSGNTSPDLVYSIQVPNYYTLVIGQPTNGYDSEINVAYGGACPGTTQIACFDDPDIQNVTWQNTTGSTQTVYWIQDGYFDASTNGTFTLAWTLTAPSYDIRVSNLVNPGVACYGTTETVTVAVKNEGTGPIDFSVTPVTVSASVTGPNPVTFTPVVLSTGTIMPGASQNVDIAVASYDMSAAGTYTFSASTSMTGDANTANDAMPATTRTKTDPVVTISPNTAFCIGQNTTLTSGLTISPSPIAFTNTTDVAIPDNNTTGGLSVINVSSGAAASGVLSVSVNIQHTYTADVDLTLIAPNGSSIDLSSDNGGAGDNYTNTVFVPTGAPSVTTGTAPFTGSFTPEQAFSLLTGSANGNWTLKVADDASTDAGTILDWTINFPSNSGIASYSWSPATGLSATNIANPVATPTSTTTYTVTIVDNSGCSATGTTTVTVNPLPTVTAMATPDVVCAGQSTTLMGMGADTYTWTGGVTDMVSFVPSSTATYTVTGTDVNGCVNTATQTVTVNPLPVVTAASSASTVCAGDMIILTGGGATSYTWDPAATDGVAFAATSTTTYTVTGTDANGCMNTATVMVTVNPLPVVVANTTASAVCAGDMITLTGSGAVSYVWDNSVTDGLTFAPAATTTYMVTGTDANGCVNTDAVTVTVNALPMVTATASSNTVCNGDMVTLTGGGADTYTWTGGVTDGLAFAATSTDTYTVTGTDLNGCVNTASTTVTVNALPVVTASASSTVCSGDMVTLNGAGADTYTWTGGVTDGVAFSATATTTYTVTGTDVNGCMNTATTTVTVNPLPVVTASSSASTVCAGDMITLTGGGATSYTWNPAVADGVAFTAMSTTTYTVTGTDVNGCMNTATVMVTVNPLPAVVANTTASAVCAGTMVTLTGSGAVSYVWDNSVTNGVAFTPSATTTYMVTGTDANGCVNTASTTVTVNALPVVTANASDNVVCAGEMVTLTGGGASTYTWTGGVPNGTPFIPTATITYTVTGTDVNGCVNTAATTVTVNALPTVSLTAFAMDTVCFQTPGFTLTGGSPAGGVYSGPGVITGLFNPASAGVGVFPVAYTVTGANGCTNTASQNITVEDCTGIEEMISAAQISIYPNPSTGVFNLVVSDAAFTQMMISIVDLQGKEVYNSIENNVSGAFQKQITLDNISKGMYYIKFSTGADMKIEKIIVQ